MKSIEEKIKRANRAFARQENWRSTLTDAYLYAHPQVNVLNDATEGGKKNTHLFTGLGQTQTRKAVGRFISATFPPEQNWCVMKSGPSVPKEQVEQTNLKLQDATNKMFSVIHNRSNFQTAMSEMGFDLWISTGVMTVQKGRNVARPVSYTAIPQHQVALEDGPDGDVGAKFRKWDIAVGMIVPTWKDAKLTDKIQKMIEEDPTKKIELHEITYTDYETDKVYYCVICPEQKSELVKRDLRMDRYVVGRLSRSPNEVNGRGPVLDALPDLKTANKLVELVLKNASMAISGPWTVVDDGVVNAANVIIGPNRMIPVARNPGHAAGPSIAPLERAGSFDIAYMEYDRLKAEIIDALLANDVPDYSGAPKTAAEILQKVRRYVEDTAAFYGRVNREIVVPIVQNTLDIMHHDWAMIDKIVVDGNFVNLEITSPLAMQQAAREVETVVQGIELSKTLFGPEQTALVFKVEEVIPWIARKLNMPETLMRSQEEQGALSQGVGNALTEVEGINPGAGLGILQQAVRGG
jgi:hypothetical protein